MSVKLTRLADDASSFYNVPLETALEKIRSGLVGEAEPLRAFGVLLSEANMKSAALSLGLKPVAGEFTEQEKVMARVKLITEGLSKAQGDHERTMGSYANQIRMLKGEFENWKADVGGPVAGGASLVMQSMRQEGVGMAIQRSLYSAFGFNTWQGPADKAAGVLKGPAPPAAAVNPGLEAIKQMMAINRDADQRRFDANKYQAPGMAGLNFMFALQGGGFGQMLNQQAMRADLNAQIREQKQRMNAWGGGHVMDTESFMKQAQERILQPKDETAKKQLDELIKARQALDKLVGKQEGKQTAAGMVLRGRES